MYKCFPNPICDKIILGQTVFGLGSYHRRVVGLLLSRSSYTIRFPLHHQIVLQKPIESIHQLLAGYDNVLSLNHAGGGIDHDHDSKIQCTLRQSTCTLCGIDIIHMSYQHL